MIYITGDIHRDFYRLRSLYKIKKCMVIVLGDTGINYTLDREDERLKDYLNSSGIKLFCVQGGFEEKIRNIKTYKEVNMFNGRVYKEKKYPNIIFAKNGEVYTIDGKKVLVIGGSSNYRNDGSYLKEHHNFRKEELSKKERNDILEKCDNLKVDIVLSHTCPLKYYPKSDIADVMEMFLTDKVMEKFLDKVEDKISYDKWYCGYFHIEKKLDKMEFMFGRIKVFDSDEYYPKYTSDGYEIIRDTCSIGDIYKNSKMVCPVCKGVDVLRYYDKNFTTRNNEPIGIVCKSCKKLYGFWDIKYKYGYPREL